MKSELISTILSWANKKNRKQLGLKELSKNTFILVLPKIVTFFLKLVRSKLSAIYLGAVGVGVVNQVTIIGNKLSGLASMSLNVGAKKLIIQFNKDEENRRQMERVPESQVD